MNRIAAVPSSGVPSLVDLKAIDGPQRAALWSKTASSYFPGLSVRELRASPTIGAVHGMPFGAGHLWTVLSPPLEASYVPPNRDDGHRDLFSVMLQLKESTVARQNSHACVLKPGDFCVMDNQLPFTLEVATGFSYFMLLQLPRDAVLGRHPYLERQTAEAFDPDDRGAVMMRQVLLNILESAPLLEKDQRAATLAAVIQLLGVPKHKHSGKPEAHWRARAALAFIDARLADHGLTASRVSRTQGISRRRLDEIMVKAVGKSLTAQIWTRRLTQAASDLRDPKFCAKSVSEIAFAAGFADAAHFTRAFKRRYDQTPRAWRARPSRSMA
jgi:AraC-like DNA-binding protein